MTAAAAMPTMPRPAKRVNKSDRPVRKKLKLKYEDTINWMEVDDFLDRYRPTWRNNHLIPFEKRMYRRQ